MADERLEFTDCGGDRIVFQFPGDSRATFDGSEEPALEEWVNGELETAAVKQLCWNCGVLTDDSQAINVPELQRGSVLQRLMAICTLSATHLVIEDDDNCQQKHGKKRHRTALHRALTQSTVPQSGGQWVCLLPLVCAFGDVRLLFTMLKVHGCAWFFLRELWPRLIPRLAQQCDWVDKAIAAERGDLHRLAPYRRNQSCTCSLSDVWRLFLSGEFEADGGRFHGASILSVDMPKSRCVTTPADGDRPLTPTELELFRCMVLRLNGLWRSRMSVSSSRCICIKWLHHTIGAGCVVCTCSVNNSASGLLPRNPLLVLKVGQLMYAVQNALNIIRSGHSGYGSYPETYLLVGGGIGFHHHHAPLAAYMCRHDHEGRGAQTAYRLDLVLVGAGDRHRPCRSAGNEVFDDASVGFTAVSRSGKQGYPCMQQRHLASHVATVNFWETGVSIAVQKYPLRTAAECIADAR